MQSIDNKAIIQEISILKSHINEIISSSIKLNAIKKRLNKGYTDEQISGLNPTTKGFVAASLLQGINKPTLLISPNISNALKILNEALLISNIPVFLLPSKETNPYDMAFNSSGNIKEQFTCLEYIINRKPCLIIANAKTLLTSFLTPEDFEKYSIKLESGMEIEPQDLAKMLIDLGYTRTPLIMDPGEFSIKGDICDIYPTSNEPIRIEFAFDEIDNIRFMNIETQRSISNTESIIIRPRYNIVISEDNKSKLLETIKKVLEDNYNKSIDEASLEINEELESLIQKINEHNYIEGIEFFAPFIHNKMANIFEYLTENTIIIIDEPDDTFSEINKQENYLNQYYKKEIESGRILPLPYLLHHNSENIEKFINKSSTIKLNTLPSQSEEETNYIEFEYNYIPSFLGNLKKAAEFINNLKKDNYNIIITTEYPQRVKSVFSEWDCQTTYISGEEEESISFDDPIITRIGPSTGFVLPEFKIATFTDTELFGKRLKRTTLTKKTSKRENLDFFLSPSDLREEDFVVHARHGIGKFLKLQYMKIDNQQREYLMLEYKNNDKLYVPVDQINLLTRYRGTGDTPPKLSKMGGADWEKTKTKAKKAIETIATDLLNLYAKRTRISGIQFDSDSNWQNEMEDAFEFVETPDQLNAINDVKRDMESEKPMDRLICGDVGYGKTEVALRGIFKAVLSGKQVAILVPTTILAQQHFTTLTERFLPYPVNISMLSRFRTKKDQNETIKRLVTGDCDIVVGTHRLIQKDVEFKNVGLVVIDEEHRFGVKHKEKLKQLREQIDVISMSATPIPRTLYMSLSGIRDMSVINTPPVNRKPVKTHVGPFNKGLIKSAIHRELERGGQVYFVHNRIQSIHRVAHDLSQLVPEARIIIGHGQMKEKELESVMLDFSVHKYDILLCTTIIESGLDIPNVNTMIIDDADNMGLAQLYQLRGRVGRSDRQAYAYCFHKPKKMLTQEAKKRLMAIREFNTLGSGYQIALRDLEIRGIGNLLGQQQHGNMVSIGFDLYCEMLEEAINKLKGEEVVKKYMPIVDINITAFIPDSWVGDKEQKIVEYKRLAGVESIRELEIISEEWKDRFGNIPKEVENLIAIVRIRLLASEVGFNLIREEEEFVRIFTNYDYKFWNNFIRKQPPQFANRTKWVKMPDTAVDGKSAILIKYKGFTPQRLINFIEELSFLLQNYLKVHKGE